MQSNYPCFCNSINCMHTLKIWTTQRWWEHLYGVPKLTLWFIKVFLNYTESFFSVVSFFQYGALNFRGWEEIHYPWWFCALLSHNNVYETYACVRGHALSFSYGFILTGVIIVITKVLLLLICHKATVSLWVSILTYSVATLCINGNCFIEHELAELFRKNCTL